MKNADNNIKITEGRQTFLKTMLVLAAGALLPTLFRKSNNKASKPNATGEKIKMLTADGKLVEVDKAHIKKGEKASGNDIKNWLNRKA